MKPSKNIFRHLLVGSLLWVPLSPVFAEPSKKIEEVVVSGTRTEKLLSESPVNVDVVPGEVIEQISIGTLEQVLDYIPGVYVSRSQKDGFNILMRGFDGDRVLVLVDGQRLPSPTGSSVDFGQISALEIERVEVVKGAASALYGSDAMGGVINIITRKRESNSLKLSQKSGANSGNKNDDFSQQTLVSGGLVFKEWSFDVSHQEIDEPNFVAEEGSFYDQAASLDKTISQAKIKFDTSFFDVQYKYESFKEEKIKNQGPFAGEGNFTYSSEVVRDRHSFISSWNDLAIKGQSSRHDELSGNRGALRLTDIVQREIDSQYTSRDFGGEWLAGLRYYYDYLHQEKKDGTVEVDQKNRDGVEAFLQGDWEFDKHSELVVGARSQNDSGFGSHSAIRGNFKYQVDLDSKQSLKWRTAVGEGYRVPNLKELDYVFDHSNLGYIVYGNSNLVPEESLSFNTSIEHSFELSARAAFITELSLHYTDTNNLIVTQSSPERSAPTLEVSEYQNIDKARMHGFDIDVSFKSINRTVSFGYNYLDSRDAIENTRLQNRPYHQIKSNFRQSFLGRRFEIVSYIAYQKDFGIPIDSEGGSLQVLNNEFSTLNLTLIHRVFEDFTWKFGSENILDTHQNYDFDSSSEFDPRPDVGRYVFVNFEYLIN